jgi:putative ABC transport system substrate-binding protein
MRRREFLGVVGGVAASWPLAASAQQGEVKRVGVLISTTQDDPQMERQVAAFRDGLRTLGWIEGRNLRLDTRFPANDTGRLQTFAAELLALRPDVLLASGPTTVLALQHVTRSVPIVFTQVNDAVGAGLVATLARPGGNVTGFTPTEFSIAGKLVELLKEIAPKVAQVGVLLDPRLADQTGMWNAMQGVASSAGVQLRQLSVQDSRAIEAAISGFAANSNGGLVILANRNTIMQRDLIIALSAKRCKRSSRAASISASAPDYPGHLAHSPRAPRSASSPMNAPVPANSGMSLRTANSSRSKIRTSRRCLFDDRVIDARPGEGASRAFRFQGATGCNRRSRTDDDPSAVEADRRRLDLAAARHSTNRR